MLSDLVQLATHLMTQSFFDLENISGNDDDEPPIPRAAACRNREPIAQIINNPDPKPFKISTAADVQYYFEKIGKLNVCKECKFVFLLSPFLFLTN